MQVYIAILRGINVSGHKLIKMEALKKRTKSYSISLIEFSSIVRKTDELQIELKQ